MLAVTLAVTALALVIAMVIVFILRPVDTPLYPDGTARGTQRFPSQTAEGMPNPTRTATIPFGKNFATAPRNVMVTVVTKQPKGGFTFAPGVSNITRGGFDLELIRTDVMTSSPQSTQYTSRMSWGADDIEINWTAIP